MVFIKFFQKVVPALFTLCQFSLSSKKSLLLLLVVSFFTFTCDEEKPVPTTGTITGKVTDQEADGSLSNVEVGLRSQGTTANTIATKNTQNTGNYDFQDVAAGSYTLSFVKLGYKEATKEVTVEGGGTGNGDIALKPAIPELAIKNDDNIVIDMLDFGTESDSRVFTISNDGEDGSILNFEITKTEDWLTLSPAGGSITKNAAGLPENITVTVDRDMIEFNEQMVTTNIIITANGSVKRKTIIAKVRRQINLVITPQEIITEGIEFNCSEEDQNSMITKTFTLRSKNLSNLSFTIIGLPSWITTNRRSGEVSNEPVTIEMMANTAGLSEDKETAINIQYVENDKSTSITFPITYIAQAPLSVMTGNVIGNSTDRTQVTIVSTITDLMCHDISHYGHVWSTTNPPNLDNSKPSHKDEKEIATLPSNGMFTSELTELRTDTNYYVMVYVRYRDGRLVKGIVKQFNTSNLPPTNPVLLFPNHKATDVVLSPTLRWQASTDPDDDPITYNVLMDQKPNPTTIVSNGQSGTTYTVSSSLTENTTYYWKVIAIDEQGNETTSEVRQFATFLNNQPPTSPILSSPNNNADVSTTPTLSWQASTDPEQEDITYDVYLGTSSTPTNSVSTGQTQTRYVVTTPLNLNTTYYWRIVAKDGTGNETTSEVRQFTILLNNQPPTAPILSSPNDQAMDVGTIPILSWQSSTDPDGDPITYDVYIGTSSNPTTVVAVNQTQTNYKLTTALSGNTTYYWRIVAKDGQGNETTSDMRQFTTMDRPSVETLRILNTSDSIIAEGRINDLKGGVIDYGFLYSQEATPIPDVNNATKESLGVTSSNEKFSKKFDINRFSDDNFNYVRTYAIYSDGTTRYGRLLVVKRKTWEPVVTNNYSAYAGNFIFVRDGKAYFFRNNSPPLYISSYDPTTSQWTKGINFLDGGRSALSFVIDEKVYVGLGSTEECDSRGRNCGSVYHKDFYRYDPATNLWARIADFPDERHSARSFVINGKAYVGFGTTRECDSRGRNCRSVYHKDFYRYDPVTNLWTQTADFPDERISDIFFVVNGKAYVRGTTSAANNFYRYDPATNLWTQIGNFPDESARFRNTYYFSFVVNGKAYARSTANNNFYCYAPATDQWTLIDHPGVNNLLVLNGKIYSLLPNGSRPSYYRFHRYDPTTNQWTRIGDFPGSNISLRFVINGQAYVGSGSTLYRYPFLEQVEIIE